MLKTVQLGSVGLLALILAGACAPRVDTKADAQVGQASAETAVATSAAIHPDAGKVVGGRDGHGLHGYALPALDTLGTTLEMVNANTGAAFTEKDLLGSWSLVYFGYMECLEACPLAMASLPGAVDALQASGIPTKAVFIDINAPRLDDMTANMGHAEHGGTTHQASAEEGLSGPQIRSAALAKWSQGYDKDIVILSGTRKQTIAATRSFQTRVEAAMMKNDEPIHHINHTTTIYVMNPAGQVTGVLYHSDSVKTMTEEVQAMAGRAPAPTSTPVAAPAAAPAPAVAPKPAPAAPAHGSAHGGDHG